ncbi:hypothetical protein OG250_04075 [Streptomyces sp. NBC_00487]|uniref:hypothetical protein n=1 Tax=unclassified Streptomyces TaxID=2593676 RepID=UPI002DD9A519|nr:MULTISPECIES: hypothetical protein [unclassified Streptomyces]WRY94171.1 hypothetical protein OG889_05190 [Streptomyces sp. NBC_00481]
MSITEKQHGYDACSAASGPTLDDGAPGIRRTPDVPPCGRPGPALGPVRRPGV